VECLLSHDIISLAGAATKLGLSVSVLTNQEASDVWAASQAAGVSKPVIWRILPSEGPAKHPEVLEAARAGLGIQVGRCKIMQILVFCTLCLACLLSQLWNQVQSVPG